VAYIYRQMLLASSASVRTSPALLHVLFYLPPKPLPPPEAELLERKS
jgi:hypothetical protein